MRKQLVQRYGDKAVLEGGLRVQIAMEPTLQLSAEKSVRAGLEAVDRRQGYRGPLGTVEPTRFAVLKPLLGMPGLPISTRPRSSTLNHVWSISS